MEPPAEILSDPDWEPSGKVRTRKTVGFELRLRVCEYTAQEYRNKRTGEKFMVQFPAGFPHNEINYDLSIEALILMLTHVCNVSSRKVQEFLFEATEGALTVSNGFISGIARKFAEKAKPDMDKIWQELAFPLVIYADTTVVPVNGEQHAATVNMNDTAALLRNCHEIT